MNKFTYALALGAGLVLSLAAPNAQADPIVQTLTPTDMSAAQFNSLFTPSDDRVDTELYAFMNTQHGGCRGVAGVHGHGRGRRLVCLRLPVRRQQRQRYVDQSADQRQQRVDAVQRDAGSSTNFTGTNAAAYVVTDGQVGGINVPQAAAGTVVQTPSSIAWLPGTTTGSLTFQYLNPTTSTGPLAAGATSGTIVVISTQPFTQQIFVSLQNPEPQNAYPKAYSPTGGTIEQVPAPSRRPSWPGPA